jgi:hypothetical protein
MNPNDHPHGGRTKSIKYPRTPWGKTTKYPRPPRPKLKLKELSKRKKKAVLEHVLEQKQQDVEEGIPVDSYGY